MNRSQRGSLDITAWLAWFLGCLGRAIDGAEELLASVLWKSRLMQRVGARPLNERQRGVLHRMMGDDWVGHLNTSKYARLARCSADTALRDIKQLLAWGLLAQNEAGGRSTSYRLAESEGEG